MTSITTWTRIEPRARAGDLGPALEAQVHDPLWTLARQWQFGEFLGDDAGSPVWVRVRATTDAATRFRPGDDGAVEEYDGSTPLEMLVEREEPMVDVRASAEAGQHFLRMLAAEGIDPGDTVTAYRLGPPDAAHGDLDPATRRYLAVMGGRVPDGDALARDLRASLPDRLPAGLGIAAEDLTGTLAVAQAWLAWADGRLVTVPAAAGSWDSERMEYRFAVGADIDGRQVAVTAPEYHGGHLDWHSFVVDGRSPALGAAAERTEIVRTVLPAPATFAGMPSRRYWEFEDARVNFGGVEASPADLGRMLVVEFATVFGGDWYVVPLEVPVGSFTDLTSVVVADTFGERSLLPRHGQGRGDASWSMFRLSSTGTAPDVGLFLPPVLAHVQESEPLEEVAFARDEAANQAWAIERRVQGAAGWVVDRTESVTGEAPAAEVPVAPSQGAALHYQLMTSVPEHWVPLLPVEVRPGTNRLRRVVLTRPGPDGEPVPLPPLGRILEPGSRLELFEEEVPHEGVTVTRTRQYSRWTDGRSFFWTGRTKRVGRGQTSSGLRFDTIDGRP
jgi:hypothetical protein